MVDEILAALLWRARLGIRVGDLRACAGHGYVDPSYRPPALPYVSVVGPLSLAVEPERDNGRSGQALLRIPGFVIGQPRPATLIPPTSGTLRLRINQRARVALSLALPGTAFGDPATGNAIADAINAAIATATVTDDGGAPVSDAGVRAAVAATTARWSPERLQLALIADAATDQSSIELLPGALDLAPVLGLAPPAQARLGRRHLHRLPPPRPMTIEMRLDLWASTQQDLASMFDGLAMGTPTRGKLVVRPSLLAEDGRRGSTVIRLLERGEPTTADSFVHLEGGDGLRDRAADVEFAALAGAAHEPTAGRFRLTGTGRMVGVAYRPPLEPNPLFATDPAPRGLACAIGVQLDRDASQAGDVYPLCAVTRGAANVVSLELRVQSAAVGQPPQDKLFAQIVARADLRRGAAIVPVETRWRVPLEALVDQPATIHAQLSTDTGAVTLWLDGIAQRLDDAFATQTPPVVAGPAATSAGTSMRVVVGGEAGQPRPLSVTHLHLVREPHGALDPRLRQSLTRAGRLRPGDVIALATSGDGWQLGDDRLLALVAAVEGDAVTLTRPLADPLRRGQAIAFQEDCFFFQTALKRRDDLMNRLYHCSIDYRVSALLEDPQARATAALVLTTHEDVHSRTPRDIAARGAPIPAPAGVGTASIDPQVEPTHDLH